MKKHNFIVGSIYVVFVIIALFLFERFSFDQYFSSEITIFIVKASIYALIYFTINAMVKKYFKTNKNDLR